MRDEKISTEAAALYDGGWTSEDVSELMEEYDITADHAISLCELIHFFEERTKSDKSVGV